LRKKRTSTSQKDVAAWFNAGTTGSQATNNVDRNRKRFSGTGASLLKEAIFSD
jgi:hypothetical protein